MTKIAVLDYRLLPEAQAQIQALAGNEIKFPSDICPADERIARTGDADAVLITPWEKIDRQYLDACPNLGYIGLCGTSTANIDLEELDKRGIEFSNIVWPGKESVAEFYFMQLTSLFRGSGKYQWREGEVHEVIGKSIGIIGLGHVGQAIAHLALAYKMDTSYFSPNRKTEWEDKGVHYKTSEDLLNTCDVVVICSPTNVEVIGKDDFKHMKPNSILVQASGGNPFDKDAFYEWMKQDGNFAIFEMSAGPANYELYKDIPRVIFSTEVAGDTYEGSMRRGRRAIENLKKYLQSK